MIRSFILYIFVIVLGISGCSSENNSAMKNEQEFIWQEQYDLGMQYLEEGDYEAAIVAFTAAIEIDPNQAVLYLERGNAYIRDGETEDNLAMALADYQQAVDLASAMAEAYLGIADVYVRQGDYDAALDILNKGLSETDSNDMIAAKIEEMESGNITDSYGNIRRRSSYDSSGNLVWYHELTYDEYGRETSVTSYDEAGTQTAHLDITYQDGLPSASYTYDTDGILDKTIRTYDNDGNVIRYEYYNGDVFWGYSIPQYDSNGYCTQSERYNADGQLMSVSRDEIDNQGNILKHESYYVNPDQSLELSEYEQYEYDSNGNVIRSSLYYGDGQLYGDVTYEYDANGNLIQFNECDPEGQLLRYVVYKYDEVGNRLSVEEYDAGGNLLQRTDL